MNEANVIIKAHHYLKTASINGLSAIRLYTDAHGTLLKFQELSPFQRFTLDMGDFVLHPDIVGQFTDGGTIFAVEGKGSTDLLKGLIQAELYQYGFHLSFLAVFAPALNKTIIQLAQDKNVGLIAVDDAVEIIFYPVPRMPFKEKFDAIHGQMETVIQAASQQTFQYNVPTHYLFWAIALERHVPYFLDDLDSLVGSYPMPKDWKSALRGAQKLGIVNIHGTQVKLTEIGSTVKDILYSTPSQWAEVHSVVSARKPSTTLADFHSIAGGILRLLLLHEPMVKLVIEGLKTFANHRANFAELAVRCDEIDHLRAPIFFLKPEAHAYIMDSHGNVKWEEVSPSDYRTSMFYQYKSILKHAGILANLKLGGSTVNNYDPLSDIWELK
jgi:hypothetical protein